MTEPKPKRLSKTKRTSITWRPGLLEWLREHAKTREVTLSQAVNDLVEDERRSQHWADSKLFPRSVREKGGE